MNASISELRHELSEWVKRRFAQVFLYTLTAAASAIGDADAVESADPGRDPDAPDTEKKSQRALVRVQPFGFNGVPPKGIRGFSLWLGKSNGWFIGIGPTKAYGPQDLGDGDSAQYSKGAAKVVCTGDDVIVNGGTKKVAIVEDAVNVGTLGVVAPPGGGTCALTFTPTRADGTPGTPVTITGVITLSAVIPDSSGSPHFKA